MTTTTTALDEARAAIAARHLHVDTVTMTPQMFSWRNNSADDELWDWIEAVECDDCGRMIVDAEIEGDEGDMVSAHAPGCEREGESWSDFDQAEGPMMNYRLPLDRHVEYNTENAMKLAELPLCLVDFPGEDQVYLALTGGGMDLSWEICEAYIALGCLPPLHYCNLPQMAGYRLTPKRALVVAACERSATISADWATQRLARLRQLAEQMTADEEDA